LLRQGFASHASGLDALIIQDPTLLYQVDVFSGLKKDGYILINTSRTFDELGLGDYVRDWPKERLCTVPATELSRKHVGRPMPNVPLLAGFAAASGLIRLESVIQAINAKFSDKVAINNIAAASEAYQFVIDEIARARQEEVAHA
jgi:pyruvate ferredoxin oxidoreductase gamma subunit